VTHTASIFRSRRPKPNANGRDFILIPPALLSLRESKHNAVYGIEKFEAVYGQVAEICFIAVTFM